MSYKQVEIEVLDIIKYIVTFYKAPLQTVKKVPAWSWLSLFVLIFIFSAITGLLRGVFSASILQSLAGFVFLPVSAYVVIFLTTVIIYALTVIFQTRTLNLKRLATLVFVTLIPALTMYVLSLLHPLVAIFGITASFILLGIGLINRFQLNKKFVKITLGVFYFLFIGLCLMQYLNIDSDQKTQNFMLQNQDSK